MLNKTCGATLIELVITITIISIALVTLLTLTSPSGNRSVDPMIREQASGIAQAYLEEITGKNFCDPDIASDCLTACTSSACGLATCTAAEGSRNQYDDVCDYAGLSDNGARDQNGVLLPGLGEYAINVQVIDSAITLGPAGSPLNANNGDVVRVDVSVDHPAMDDTIRLSGYRANY